MPNATHYDFHRLYFRLSIFLKYVVSRYIIALILCYSKTVYFRRAQGPRRRSTRGQVSPRM